MKKIPLTKGKFALVDDEDYDFLMQFKWQCSSDGYAIRSEKYYDSCGKRRHVTTRMHRVINNTPKDVLTDHKNGDKLDNRRKNLRDCTTLQNSMNQKSHKDAVSKFKGVSWHKGNEKWLSRIQIEGVEKSLGYFDSEIEAARAYDKAAEEYHGKFIRLNEVKNGQ